MRPSGALMIEHRRIEKILPVIQKRISRQEKDQPMDPVFIDTVVDFFRFYADWTHHGKEEDILFMAIGEKELSNAHNRMKEELIKEHAYARSVVGDIVECNKKYRLGDKTALDEIIKNLKILIGFYPKHIKKEDEVFFPEVMKYFSREELDLMLHDFWDFDSKMIHEKYDRVLESLNF